MQKKSSFLSLGSPRWSGSVVSTLFVCVFALGRLGSDCLGKLFVREI